VDVGENTTLGNGDVTKKLVQLLVVADGELEVTGNDTGLLVVTGGVTSQLEDFSGEVLEDGCEVDRSTGTNTLSVVTLAEQTVNTANGEGQTSLGGTAEDTCQYALVENAWINNLRLRVLAAASLAAGLSASHFDGWVFEKGGRFGGKRVVKCRRLMSEIQWKVARAGGRACGSGGPL
jgi:hypothetical protein